MKTIKRHAIVGERILITNKVDHESRYKDGDIFTVASTRYDGDVYTKEGDVLVFAKEYEVIVAESSEFAAGDKVELLSGGGVYPLAGFRNGETYTLTALAGEDAHDDFGHSGNGLGMISGGSSGDRIGYAEPSQLRKIPAAVEIKNGSRVILQAGGGDFPLYGFENGAEYEVSAQIDPKKAGGSNAGRLQIKKLSGIGRGYALPSQLQPVPAAAAFEVGDRVEVINSDGTAFRVGDIGKVTDITAHIGIRLDSGTLRQWFTPKQLRKISAASTAKPAPVEFKVGDRVQSIEQTFKGEFGNVIKTDTDGTSRVMFDSGISHWKSHINLVNIAPAVETVPEFSPGDIVINTNNGREYTLKERRPSCDGSRHGKAWGLVGRPTWLGEGQIEATGKKAPMVETIILTAGSTTAAPEFKVGDRVKSLRGLYDGQEGVITKMVDEEGCEVKFDSGASNFKYFRHLELVPAAPVPAEPAQSLKVGDIIAGKPGNGYGITTDKMTRGEVVEVTNRGIVKVKVLEHSTMRNKIGSTYNVHPEKFVKVEDAAPFKVGDRVVGIEGAYLPGVVGTITDTSYLGGVLFKPDNAINSRRIDGKIYDAVKFLVKISE